MEHTGVAERLLVGVGFCACPGGGGRPRRSFKMSLAHDGNDRERRERREKKLGAPQITQILADSRSRKEEQIDSRCLVAWNRWPCPSLQICANLRNLRLTGLVAAEGRAGYFAYFAVAPLAAVGDTGYPRNAYGPRQNARNKANLPRDKMEDKPLPAKEL